MTVVIRPKTDIQGSGYSLDRKATFDPVRPFTIVGANVSFGIPDRSSTHQST